MHGSVIIDCFPESVRRLGPEYTIVAVDVIRATTSAVTVAALGQRCFPVASIVDACQQAAQFENPLLVGEVGGLVPEGFHMNNSPADLAGRLDRSRPVILLSSSGTQLIHEASLRAATYVACFRNHRAVARRLAVRHSRVAVIGAGSRGQFREEDQICCAWIAGALMRMGYTSENHGTLEIVERWQESTAEACLVSPSVHYLRKSGQIRDLEFILSTVNDLDVACLVERGEVVALRDDGHGPESEVGALASGVRGR